MTGTKLPGEGLLKGELFLVYGFWHLYLSEQFLTCLSEPYMCVVVCML